MIAVAEYRFIFHVHIVVLQREIVMLTIHSNWYAPYTGKIKEATSVVAVNASRGLKGISIFGRGSLDPMNQVHYHPTVGIFQTFISGNYISIPYPRHIPQDVLNWRWDNIRKKRQQMNKSKWYAKSPAPSVRCETHQQHVISEEYINHHQSHAGKFLNLNA